MPPARKAATPAKRAAARTAARRTSRPHVRTAAARMRAEGSNHLRHVKEALTAAAEVMESGSNQGGGQDGRPGSATRTWQHAATGYTRTVPELNAGKMYVGNCMSRIRLKVGKRNPDGTVDPIPDGVLELDPDTNEPKEQLPQGVDKVTYGRAVEVASTIRSKLGGAPELMRSYGEKMFVSGECYVLPEDSPAGLTFDVLSTQELAKEGSGWTRYNGPGYDNETVPEGIEPIRVWRPDDTYGKLATSSVRACLEILEELVVLTRLVRSSAISRIALAGVLVLSEELDDPIDDEAEDGQTSEATNPLLVDIILNGAKAIDDPASAAAWLPYLLTAPTKLVKDGVNFVKFEQDDAVNVLKRREALERLAQGLDLPVEVILGHQQTTFANAAQISEDTFKLHIEPSVSMFADSATLGILWPALAKKAGLQADAVAEHGYPPEILSVALYGDASQLVSHPDRSAQVVETFTHDLTQTAVRIYEVRDALGLDPDAAPDNDEVARRLQAYKTAHERETLTTPGSSATVLDELNGTVTPVDLPPGTADAVGVNASAAVLGGLSQRIAGAADMTLDRVAERVGSRLRSRVKGEQAAQIEQVHNREVTRVLGPATTAKLLNGDDPVRVELAAFERAVDRWALEAGHPHHDRLAKACGALLETAVADRLYSQTDPRLEAGALASLAAATG